MMLFFFILGWLFKLKLTRPEELEMLMDEKAYKKYCETLEWIKHFRRTSLYVRECENDMNFTS